MSYSVERFSDRPSWLKGRQSGIGASDASAIVGMSSFASAYSVWIAKTETVQVDEPDELAYWGTRLEPVIADEFWRVAQDAIRND